jgi:hypothetical protein
VSAVFWWIGNTACRTEIKQNAADPYIFLSREYHDQLKLFYMQVFGGVDSAGYEFTLYGITFRSHVKKSISVPIKNAIFRGIIATERCCFAQLLKVVYISYRLGALFAGYGVNVASVFYTKIGY